MRLLAVAALLAPALLNGAMLTYQTPHAAGIDFLEPMGELADNIQVPIYTVEAPLYEKSTIGAVTSSVYRTEGGYDFHYELELDEGAYPISQFTVLFCCDNTIDAIEVGVLAPQLVMFAAFVQDVAPSGPAIPSAAEWYSWSDGRVVNFFFDDPVMPGSQSATIVLRTEAAYYQLVEPASLVTVVLPDGHPRGLSTDGALFAAVQVPEPGTFWGVAGTALLWASLRKSRGVRRPLS